MGNPFKNVRSDSILRKKLNSSTLWKWKEREDQDLRVLILADSEPLD